MYVLLLDPASGAVTFDAAIGSSERPGYLDFNQDVWPHRNSGPAWAHAALFLRPAK